MSQENKNNAVIILQEIAMGKYDKAATLKMTAAVGSTKGISADDFYDFLKENEDVDAGKNVGAALADKFHGESLMIGEDDADHSSRAYFESNLVVALREYDDANDKQDTQKRIKAVEALHTTLLPKFTEQHKDDAKKSKILENFVVIERPVLPKIVTLDLNS